MGINSNSAGPRRDHLLHNKFEQFNNSKNAILGRPPKRFPVSALERIPLDPNLYQVARALRVDYSTVYRWWRGPLYPATYRRDEFPFPATSRRDEGRRHRVMSKADLILWIIRSGRVNGSADDE
jgi:hypothetical protein